MANVNFILDEAKNLGANMKCLEDAIDKYRGYGIRLQLYYQALAQLKECFSDQDQTVLANCTQVFVAVNDSSAEYVSNRLGEQTIVVASGGSNCGDSRQHTNGQSQASSSYSRSYSNNWNQMGRRLLKPEEVLCLNERIAIAFVPGLPPIATRLERYYEKHSRTRQSAGFRMFCGALVVALVGLYCSSETLKFWEQFKYVRSIQRFQEFHSGSQR